MPRGLAWSILLFEPQNVDGGGLGVAWIVADTGTNHYQISFYCKGYYNHPDLRSACTIGMHTGAK